MAIAILGNASDVQTSASSHSFPYTCHKGINRKLVIVLCVTGSGGGSDDNTVTYHGSALSGHGLRQGVTGGAYTYYLDEDNYPSTPGSYTVSVTYLDTKQITSCYVIELSGAKETRYDLSTSAPTGTSVSESLDVVAGGIIIGGISKYNDAGAFSPDSGQTELYDDNNGTHATCMGYETFASTATGESWDWSWSTSAKVFSVAISLEPEDLEETLNGGTYSLTGGGPNIELEAPLGGGTFSFSGGDIEAQEVIALLGGIYSYTGGDIDVNFSGILNETLNGGSYSYSGGLPHITVSGTFYEDLIGGSYSLSGAGLIPWASWRPYSNSGRHYALPGERMRGCVLAEDFYSHIRTNMAGGNALGGPVYSNSAYVDGLAHFVWNEVPLEDTFTAVIQFSAASASNGLLFGTEDVPSATVDGWQITVDSTGIRANHSDGSAAQTQCSIDVNYADGENHTVTYVVDMVSGDHTLYVDGDSDTQSTTSSGTIGSGALLRINDGGFAGTLNFVRLFDSVLAEEEHQVYVAGTLSTIVDNALATYRCDTLSDRDDHIWSKLLTMRDLTKGDGAGNDYPTLTDSHYVFGGTDYVSDWPDRPATWTDSAAFETSGYPYITQVNDNVIKTSLTVPGFFNGKLYNLILHEGELTDLEENELEFRQLFYTERDYAKHIDCQLINEEACFLSYYYSNLGDIYTDYSRTTASNSNNNVFFDDPGIRVFGWNIASFTSFDMRAMTVEILGTNFQSTGVTETLTYVPGFFSFDSSPYDASNLTLSIGGSSAIIPRANLEHITMTVQDGSKPRFFANGEFVSEGDTTISFNSSLSTYYIGSKEFGSDHAYCTFYKCSVHKSPMTNAEVKTLYLNSKRFFEETT